MIKQTIKTNLICAKVLFFRIISITWLVAATASITFIPVSASCETLRFVFLADSRGSVPEQPVHLEALQPIIKKIGELRHPIPAFVIFGGDMSYRGYIKGSSKDGYTFQGWKDLFTDLSAKGIDLYTAIGNHELYHEHAGIFVLGNQQEFQKVFSENPNNGPPGYKHLTYSFTSPGGDAFFAVLDPYYITEDIPDSDYPNKIGGHIYDVQLKWLSNQVAKTRATHKFLFIHVPYYYVTAQDPEEASTADESLMKLWTILDNNRFDFYACGHEHLYSRKTIDRHVLPIPHTLPPHPPWKHNVVQLLNGTSGAGPGQETPLMDPNVWHISQTKNTYYFSVIDINDGLVKGTTWGYNTVTLKFTVIDKFIIDHSKDYCPDILDQSEFISDFSQSPLRCHQREDDGKECRPDAQY